MAKISLTDILSGYSSTTTINANNALIEAAFDNTLSRDGSTPNTMGADLDMNSNNINNLADATQAQQAVTLAQLQAVAAGSGSIAASLVTLEDAAGKYVSNNVEGALAELGVNYPLSAEETANSITPSDYSYVWGDVRRYGAVADAVAGSGGTDDTTAFQNAVDSGHDVYIPEGYYAIEGTIQVLAPGGATGGIKITASGLARMEKFTDANSDPILHMSGALNFFDGGGCTFAVREYGEYKKGVVLLGCDPDATDETDVSALDTTHMTFQNCRILGNSGLAGTPTTKDGTVGLYVESCGRRRGGFISPTTLNFYYNTIHNINILQCDYCYFFSTDCNANTISNCKATNFGTAGFWLNGYGNQVTGCSVEGGVAWDTRERGAWTLGGKDSGPESFWKRTDNESAYDTIVGITKGNPTTITTSGAHSFSTGNKTRLLDIVDNGPDGDLETALNGGAFEVTDTGTSTFTIPIDTSGLTNTYSSGGKAVTNMYSINSAWRNSIMTYNENAFDGSTKRIRGVLQTQPTGAYDTEKDFEASYGQNNIVITGTLSGGVGASGYSTRASLLNNYVEASAVDAKYGKVTIFEDWEVRNLDDRTGVSFGTDEKKEFSGRITGLDESTPYAVWVYDDLGATGGCFMVTLTFAGKVSGAASENNHAGEIKWACFQNPDNTQAAVQLSRLESDDGDGHPLEWSCATATGTSGTGYGKFSVTATTNALTGTNNNFYYSWHISVTTSQLQDSNIDWDADITMLDGDQGGGP